MPVSHTARRLFLAGLALAIVGSVLFSAKAIVVKLAYRHGVDAATLIALRMAFSVPFFIAAYLWSSRGAPALTARDHRHLIVIGLLGYYAASYLDFLGLQFITAALERLILYLNPTIVLLMSALFLGKRFSRRDVSALALAYGGILLVFLHDVSLAGEGVPLGAMLVFASAVCYAVYLVMSGELVRRVGAIRLTSYAMCVSTVAVFAQFALLNPLGALRTADAGLLAVAGQRTAVHRVAGVRHDDGGRAHRRRPHVARGHGGTGGHDCTGLCVSRRDRRWLADGRHCTRARRCVRVVPTIHGARSGGRRQQGDPMKAKSIVVRTHGGADVLELTELDVPDPGPDEVRIRQHAIGLNYIDVYYRTGLYSGALPHGLGFEGAGVVEAVGSNVKFLKSGDRVAYPQGPLGAYSEARTMPAATVVRLPKQISFEQGAAVMLKGLTVQYLFRQTYRLQGHETILFHAAAGGVGLIACQWARALGVKLIGTVSSPEKAALAKKAGAWQTIDYSKENFVERVLQLTGGKKLPVVYDGVGKSTWDGSLDCIEPRGLMVSFGNASGAVTGVAIGILGAEGVAVPDATDARDAHRAASAAGGLVGRTVRPDDRRQDQGRHRTALSARGGGPRASRPRGAQDSGVDGVAAGVAVAGARRSGACTLRCRC